MEVDDDDRIAAAEDSAESFPSASSAGIPGAAPSIAGDAEEEVEEVLLYLRFPHFEHTTSLLFGPPSSSVNAASNNSSSGTCRGGMLVQDLHTEEPSCRVDLGPGMEVLEFKGSHQISLGKYMIYFSMLVHSTQMRVQRRWCDFLRIISFVCHLFAQVLVCSSRQSKSMEPSILQDLATIVVIIVVAIVAIAIIVIVLLVAVPS
jgi:hypothetical protein